MRLFWTHEVLRSDRGTSLIELLAASALLLVVGTGVLTSGRQLFQTRYRAERNTAAMELANERVELLSIQDPATLSAVNGYATDVSTTYQGVTLKFRQVLTIVIEADGSRTITVSETSTDVPDVTVSVSSRVPLRGSV